MNRRISMVLAAIAASAVATPALANDPGKMFMINAVTPGVVSFSGEGTAQFNNASTTANAFSVGSSTNFGVNASASSTLDYMVDANALLQLAGTSQLQQTIGTSSSAANTQAASEAAMTAATTVADRETNETFGSTFADYVARNGGSSADITAAGSGDGIVSNGAGDSYQGDYTSTAQYDAAKNSFFNEKVNENFSNTVNTANESASANNNADGTISGVFDSSSYSRSQIGATASAIQTYTEQATREADAAFGTSYSGTGEGTYTAQFNALDANDDGVINEGTETINANAAGLAFNAGTGAMLTQENWSSAKEAAIDSTVNDMTNSASSNGDSESKNNATVNVQGVGSIATLNASEDSAFNVDVATRIRTQLMTTNGTANGSAGGNLATSSFANQSLSQSASAFIQAFGADTVSLQANDAGQLTGATVSGRLNVGIGVIDPGDAAYPAGNLTVTVPVE
jgi:hypothetical protein